MPSRSSPPAGPATSASASEPDVFAALGDPVRREILELVVAHGPVTATALTSQVPITRQGIAKHLDVLRSAGLVTSERHGRETRYSASLAALDDVSRWVATVGAQWDHRLSRLADRVSRSPRPAR